MGQELDQLMRQGAAVFHDIPADNFNIDHVVISSEGVFAVETRLHEAKARERESGRDRSFRREVAEVSNVDDQ